MKRDITKLSDQQSPRVFSEADYAYLGRVLADAYEHSLHAKWMEVQYALDELTCALDCGYIIGTDGEECSACGAKATIREDIMHEDGCIARPMDRLVRALIAMRSGSSRAAAVREGDGNLLPQNAKEAEPSHND